MTSPGPANTSQTARLMIDPPGFAVGWQEPVAVADPGAGNNWAYQVDGRYFERVVAIRFTFTASAVVGNRHVYVDLVSPSGLLIARTRASGAVAAGGALSDSLTVTSVEVATGSVGENWGRIPAFLAPPGYVWQSSVGSLDAGDAFTGISLLTQRFPNDAARITAGG